MVQVAVPNKAFVWGQGGEQVTPEVLERRRKVADALRQKEGYVPPGWMSLIGGLAGEGVAAYKEQEADRAESEAKQRVADALLAARSAGSPDAYLDVLSDPFASPQQAAVANALYQQAQPKWETFEANGDILRWNANDPNSQPEVFYDGPDPVPDAPTIVEIYDETTGRSRKGYMQGTEFVPLGGIEAPKEPLVDVNVNNGGADEEFYKAGAKARGEAFAGIEAAGMQAQTKIGQINRLEELLGSAPQGLEGGWKQLAGEFGIASEGLDDIQAAQALINKLVPEQRTPGSGPMSDADLALFKQSMPRIINQPGGNSLIIQTLKGIAVYEQTMGDIATRVLNKEITPAEGRAEMAKVPNPLELFRKGGGSASDPGNAPEGVDPEDWAVMTPEQRALWD